MDDVPADAGDPLSRALAPLSPDLDGTALSGGFPLEVALLLALALVVLAILSAAHALLVTQPAPAGPLDGRRADLPRTLSRLLVGSLSATVLAYWAALMLWRHFFPALTPWALVATGAIVLGPAVAAVGRVIPRTLALRRPASAERALRGPFEVVHLLLLPLAAPLSGLLSLVTGGHGHSGLWSNLARESELRQQPHLSEEGAMLDEGEREMIEGVLDFGETTAVDIMTPRNELQTVSLGDSRERVEEIFRETPVRRLLVHGDTADQILGFIHLRDFVLQPQEDWKNLLREPLIIPPTMTLASLLEEIRKRQVFIAVVVDEYGGTAGVVTLKDIYQAIVGEIRERHEPRHRNGEAPIKPVQRTGENTWRIWGRMEVEELNDELPAPLPEEKARTVSGLMVNTLGHIPEIGEEMTTEHWRLRVERMAGPRIDEIVLELANAAAKGEDEEK